MLKDLQDSEEDDDHDNDKDDGGGRRGFDTTANMANLTMDVMNETHLRMEEGGVSQSLLIVP